MGLAGGHPEDLAGPAVERLDEPRGVEREHTRSHVGDDRRQVVLESEEARLRLAELGGAGLDHGLQVAAVALDLSTACLELAHHAVEGLGHAAHLVARGDGQPHFEVPGGGPGHGVVDSPHRRQDHAR